MAGVLAVVAVADTTQQVVRVGHAGAKATWNDVATSSPSSGDQDGHHYGDDD